MPLFLLWMAVILAVAPRALGAENASPPAKAPKDIVGVVSSAKGPEAGVWVIAETHDLPTKFVRIVVTDDEGRFRIPDLPKAKYQIWVRGYGLIDSKKQLAQPGASMKLGAVVAANAAAAAAYYPAVYWFAMLHIPDASEFPGTEAAGNGISSSIKTQEQWLEVIKTDGCYACHQFGDKATREIPAALGKFPSSVDAWERRIQSGQAGAFMANTIGNIGAKRALAMFADWSDRIAKGELPASAPARPQGVERNIVITEWDWSKPTAYLHDEVSTDRRNPTINAHGKIYGSPEDSTDDVPILDPVRNEASHITMPVRDPKTPGASDMPVIAPSPYWGEQAIWDGKTSMHNPMIDGRGRVWFTARIRPPDDPNFCKAGSDLISAKLFPLSRSYRQLAVYDPSNGKITLIDTCFGTHHLQFGYDSDQTLWTSAGGGGDAVGWLNTERFDETGDERASQGWTALVLDTNGDGKRGDYVEPKDPVDPAKDKRISGAFYAVAPSPVDGSVWGTILGMPGSIVRLTPGNNAPATTLAEIFELPWNDPKAPVHGYSPRGADVDSQGVVWASLASGHFASFDRRKCKGPLNGPTATGNHCPEGWTLYPFPGPQFAGLNASGSAEASYYSWVDQHDTFGLGHDVPIATGNGNDALLALVDGKFVTLRVPYPMGFYAKGLDGRIDDPNGEWKGRGLWATYGTRTPFHAEGGKGTTSKVLHFQLRPDPLAG